MPNPLENVCFVHAFACACFVHAFVCNVSGDSTAAAQTNFEGGITRSNYLKWTNSGLSEVSPLSLAFSCRGPSNRNESESASLRAQLNEVENVETVFAYPDKTRVAFPHSSAASSASMNGQHNHLGRGHKERKEKMSTIDIALPAAPYDLRLTLATETPMKDDSVTSIQHLPNGWNKKRIKRRSRSAYCLITRMGTRATKLVSTLGSFSSGWTYINPVHHSCTSLSSHFIF